MTEYRKKLIEVVLPLAANSVESAQVQTTLHRHLNISRLNLRTRPRAISWLGGLSPLIDYCQVWRLVWAGDRLVIDGGRRNRHQIQINFAAFSLAGAVL